MPRGDRTGPRGMGPMTGRAAGFCAGHDAPGYANPTPGRGFGMGGGGRGWRHGYLAMGPYGRQSFGAPAMPEPVAGPQTERQALGRQAKALQRELDAIKKRLAAIGDGPDEG